MNDQIPVDAVDKGSAVKDIPRPRRKPGPKKTMDSLFGLFLFAFGLGAVMAVLYLGYFRFFHDGPPDGGVDTIAGREATAVQLDEEGGQEQQNQPLNNAPTDIRLPTMNNLTGKWHAKVLDKNAYVTFYGGEYQLLYIDSPLRQAKSYSAGRYEYDQQKGIIMLEPDADKTKALTGDVVTNDNMTARDFKIQLAYDAAHNSLYWRVPEGSGDIHPLFFFMRSEKGVIAWNNVKQ